ncbi:hypothetical protein [Saccharothrix sp.]|uniref:hypothetical protein n=1 Tax=Saccharothrix sp. TaxID=1873460 RepID=UPI0028124201|nr:hypothetical protein [Saccharothrix sp.]
MRYFRIGMVAIAAAAAMAFTGGTANADGIACVKLLSGLGYPPNEQIAAGCGKGQAGQVIGCIFTLQSAGVARDDATWACDVASD